MDKIDILLWIVGSGLALVFGLMMVMWNSITHRFDLSDRKIEKLDEKLTDVDRRLCRLEGAFASKDCCMIKDERHLKRTEE